MWVYVKWNESEFDFESTAFCEFALASGWFREDVFAVVAGDDVLGVTEDDSCFIASSAFDIHKVGVGGGKESFEFMSLFFCF